jgi:cyclophilin family peptidyl-prolyl cis-trans isomerase
VGTAKRERQKANRQVRLEELAREARKVQRKRSLWKGGVAIILAAAIILVLVYATGGKKSPTASSTSSTIGSSDVASTVAGDPGTTVASGPFVYGGGDCPAADGSSPATKTFSGPPKQCIDPTKTYTATFETSEGNVKVALDTTRTPGTVNNFVTLARWHYYDGTTLFRTASSIDIIQGGGNSGNDPSPYHIPDEGGRFQYSEGELIMARDPQGGGVQFFFSTGPNTANLNGQGTYVTFGKTTEGLDVLKKIIALNDAPPSSGGDGKPSRTVTVTKITIAES